ncbi:MAG: AMP-binding protein [Gammaproteobacteria bacterium]|nr:AMP-binding protein [Gammaproteobacteria bacterium]MCP4089412.1 AMP-binding protein [Gammaproteobacteria bacterium]MCP4277527.1 AMP-binding protein [Gammaproteobacteria bacterium]MCP4831135.1 AMP-binding protein [Gammaproteobacteria bacterium]MCP4928558.1 AMP-binding protein [Gammaproteobacteria bacterium]
MFTVFEQHFPDDQRCTLIHTPEGRRYSYMEALDEASRIARCLTDLGLQPGDRVTVQVEKSPEAVWLYLACLQAGLIFHPLNTDYQLDELVYFIDNAEPSAIICDPAKEQLFSQLTEGKHCEILTLSANGQGSLNNILRETPPDFTPVPRKADDIAVLLYSSGTTGIPKGAKISHGNLSANIQTLAESWGFTSNDRLLHTLPIYHAHGLFVAIGCVLMSGSSMTFLSRFKTETVLDALPDCTVMMGVPTFYTRLLTNKRLTPELCSNMRLFISGSAPLSVESFTAFKKRTGHAILERYGMTETSMNASNPLEGERRPGSVGPALPGVSFRITDDNGNTLPTDEIGHLQVKGPNVFSGYWRMHKKSAAEFTEDGYFKTGDKAFIEADGYVTIVGRAKDMVISGGLNVYPREVETLLDSLPDIAESAVIGVPHPDFGEGVVAIVVPLNNKQISGSALIAQIRPQMATYKLPKQVFTIEQLPRNSMGKVQKNQLRKQFINTFQAN